MVCENLNLPLGAPSVPNVYIAPLGDSQYLKAVTLTNDLRQKGISAETDITGRGLKAQMKYADKTHAKFAVVLGENEVNAGIVTLKNMRTGAETPVAINRLEEALRQGGAL
jgi:histidyl-tRNA synthetase